MFKDLIKGIPKGFQKKLITDYVKSLSPEERKQYSDEYIDLLLKEFLDVVSHEKRLEIGTTVMAQDMKADEKTLYVNHFSGLILKYFADEIKHLPDDVKKQFKSLLD